MRKIFFHIGLGKTGTSYLQSAFAINSERYKKEGFLYPDLDGNFKEACNGQTTSGNGLRIAAGAIPELARNVEPYDLMDLCRSFDSNFNYLISSEWLSGAGEDFLNKINKIFSEKFECRFILVVRNPADHIASIYLQGLKMGVYKFGIEYYLDELIAQEIGYLSLADKLRENLIFINYDVHKKNLIGEFDKLIFGRCLSNLPCFKYVNQSPDCHQAEILRMVSFLNLSDFHESMVYVQLTNNYENSKGNYLLDSNALKKINSELSHSLDIVNQFLPKNELLEFNDFSLNYEQFKSLFSADDLNFISKLINIKFDNIKKTIYKYLFSYFKIPDGLNSDELPLSFNSVKYLLLNPDLIENKVNPVEHYLKYGRFERRIFELSIGCGISDMKNSDPSLSLDCDDHEGGECDVFFENYFCQDKYQISDLEKINKIKKLIFG